MGVDEGERLVLVVPVGFELEGEVGLAVCDASAGNCEFEVLWKISK